MIYIRHAGALDANAMARLLNEIIHKGGTTAFTNPVTCDTITQWLTHRHDASAWQVVEDDNGTLLGFQSIEPRQILPADACDIGTFVSPDSVGLGVGTKLFEASHKAATALGYRWINATIRTDNAGGLAYYQSRGFENYALHPNIRLENGLTVDKISKRFDL
ncbi:GNAT family N-acetyltransferase [Roseovarius sp. EL26]|uniref:GNAT family N-acetyltransferase n=1 Tax=Roseovarius sp. EL26 TaxID=2126672 RepID=UPI000EA12E65|nr:GNAT family N-acetyltransferase [Roseovarius sp. EL26]